MSDQEKDLFEDAAATVDESEINELFEEIQSFPHSKAEASPGGTASDGDAPTVEGGATLAAIHGGEGTEGGEGDEGVGGVSEGAEGPGAPEKVDLESETEPEGDIKPAGGETPEVEGSGDSAEVAALKQQVTNLTAMVEKMSSGIFAPPAAQPQVAQPVVPSLEDVFKDADLDEVLESKENFLKFFTSAMGVVQQQTRAEIIKDLPSYVGPVITERATLENTVGKFYTDYPELQGVKSYVSFVAKEVAAEHPDWDVSKVLEESATRAKTSLNLTAQPAPAARPARTGKMPVLPGGSRGAKAPVKQSSSLVDEINEIILD